MSNAAKSIRADLKAAGFSLQAFSIRTCRTGSVRVEIKDASIRKSAIVAIAARQEHIRRDEGGEILSGGNTFVFVTYDRAALAEAGAELTARLRCGLRRFAGVHVDGEGADCRHTWKVWSNADGRWLAQMNPNDGAALAETLADRGELAAALAELAARNAEPPRCGACKCYHDAHADC